MTEQKCPHCLIDAGRLTAKLRCCMVREIAKRPPHAQQAAYESVNVEEGRAAMEELKREVKAEAKRLAGLREAKKSNR